MELCLVQLPLSQECKPRGLYERDAALGLQTQYLPSKNGTAPLVYLYINIYVYNVYIYIICIIYIYIYVNSIFFFTTWHSPQSSCVYKLASNYTSSIWLMLANETSSSTGKHKPRLEDCPTHGLQWSCCEVTICLFAQSYTPSQKMSKVYLS
jgi:hypothetical protein